jgi:hypothetical protein
MPVFSCRPPQRIDLPSLAVFVQLLDIVNGEVRLQIDAPPGTDVRLAETQDPPPAGQPTALRTHRLRNQLNQISLALHLARRQWQAGLADDAEKSLTRASEVLDRLETELAATQQ